MKYLFSDIYNEDLYKNSSVLFVVGPYAIFNNIAVDNMKNECNGKGIEDTSDNTEDNLTGIKINNALDFENFKILCRTPSITGKWYTVVDIDSLNKKGVEWIKEYIKNPSEYTVLCITSTQFKNYKFWLNNKSVNTTINVNALQLSWPHRDTVNKIVKLLFKNRNRDIEQRAVELFIVRMGHEYNEYDRVIDKICNENTPDNVTDYSELKPISYDETLESMKGIESYGIDEFIERLTLPLTSDVVSSRKQVYRMLMYLIESYGARKLVAVLKTKIADLIEYREAINNGTIPILVDFNVAEAKRSLGEESRLANKTDYRFKVEAKLASKTSLKDWVYMSMILENISSYNDISYQVI